MNAISLDYFLYSCFEFEKLNRSLPEHARNKGRWPVCVTLDHADAHLFSTKSLNELVYGILKHYTDEFPKMNPRDELSLETLGDVSAICVFLLKDLKVIAKEKLGVDELPMIKADAPLDDTWQIVQKELKAMFPKFYEYMWQYVQWAYAVVEEDLDENASRPPLGRFSPFHHRRPSGSFERRDRPGAQRGPKKGGRGDHRGGERGRDHGGRKEFKKDFKKDFKSDQRRRPESKPVDKEAETACMAAVAEAVRTLQTNPSLGEVRLPPANSFFRHMQHNLIKEEGFDSHSVGEGSERTVVVTRR